MTRVIIITGKGGVGKSSVAAATALVGARQGLRTALVSVDSAHNLSDIFARRVGDDLTSITDNLTALEVDLNREIRTHWGAIVAFFRHLTLNNPRVNEIVAEECAVFPGMEELFGLFRLKDLIESGEYDFIVVDAPPTGDMMKFLRLPDVLEWFLTKFLPLEKKLLRTARPVASHLKIPLPDEGSLDNLTYWHDKVGKLSSYFMDFQHITARIVMTPDRVCLEETRRAFSTLCLFGLMVDAIIVNKLFPCHDGNSFLCFWSHQQRQLLSQIASGFAPLPVLTAELLAQEVIGIDHLETFGRQIYRETPPESLLMEEPPFRLAETPEAYELYIRLPFLEQDHFHLWITHDALIVNLYNQRRRIPLPDALLRREMIAAHYQNGRLCVAFRRENAGIH